MKQILKVFGMFSVWLKGLSLISLVKKKKKKNKRKIIKSKKISMIITKRLKPKKNPLSLSYGDLSFKIVYASIFCSFSIAYT